MRTLRPSSVFSVSVLALMASTVAACVGAPDTGDVASSDLGTTAEALSSARSIHYGVDYSDARPSLSGIKKEGYTFVARYLSYETSGDKNLTKGEAEAIKKAGLSIVLDWEYAADAALSGREQGIKDAKAADEQAKAVGAPADAVIYFSLDFDVQSDQYGVIDAYFEGVASVIGRARTGAYGGYYPIEHLFNVKKIDWAWQTYAWSDGKWDSRAQLRQIENGVDNGAEDKDEAVVQSFGQWDPGAPPETVGEKIAKLALANLNKKACSENSKGKKDFDSSCHGNGGEPEYWCADFARWVWANAGGGVDTAGLDAAAGSFYTYGERHHTLHTTPALGDAVVFDYQGNGVADHVAIVTKVDANGDIETVSGDWGGDNGTEAEFASTSHVRLNAPAYSHKVGSDPAIMGMRISGFIAPHE